mmetsp:Transcript_4991/g.13940  ORF Transcript_4991/g.13940 Transcript_4991/m.13940 type:complete len:476 (-) Transcript_4991:132-1559(-)
MAIMTRMTAAGSTPKNHSKSRPSCGTKRRRTTATAAIVLLVASCCSDSSTVDAFVVNDNNKYRMMNGPLHRHVDAPLPLVLHATPAATTSLPSSSISSPRQSKRKSQQDKQHPSKDELLTLLSQTVELRRLKQVQREQQLLQHTSSLLPQLQICRAAGYGDDLTAYEQALQQGQEARDALITRNMGLVRHCVRDICQYRTLQSLSTDDLIQEGAIGLSRAIDKWNMDIGGTFSTYAMYWIRAAVFRCIAERDDLVRTPVHVTTSLNKMTAAARELGIESWKYWNDSDSVLWKEAKAAKQLAEAAGLSEDALQRALQVKRRRSKGGIKSFEIWMQQGQDLSSDHADAQPLLSSSTTTTTTSSSYMDLEHLRNQLAKFLSRREVEALSWRYGLNRDNEEGEEDAPETTATTTNKRVNNNSRQGPATKGRWGEAMSFVEVGKRMHVSAEYGRRLTKRALDKLRLAHEEGRLEPGFLAV